METLCSLANTHISIQRGCALILWPAVAPIQRCCAVGLMASSVIYTQHRGCAVILWLALMSVYRKCVIGLVASSGTYTRTKAVHLVLLLALIKSSRIVCPCWKFMIVKFSVVIVQKKFRNYIISTTHMILFCWVCLLLCSAYTNIPLHYFFIDLVLSTSIFISFSESFFERFSLSFNDCLYLFNFLITLSVLVLLFSLPFSFRLPLFFLVLVKC